MSTPETRRAIRSVEAGSPVGEVRIDFPLTREDYDDQGNIKLEKENELLGILTTSKHRDEIKTKWSKWFRKTSKDVESSKKSGWYYPAIGGVVFLIAVGAGYEFGLKQGKDIRVLIAKADKYIADQRRLRRKNKTA